MSDITSKPSPKMDKKIKVIVTNSDGDKSEFEHLVPTGVHIY